MQELAEADKEKIQASMANLLASNFFTASPRQKRFLEYLVTNTLNGNTSRLKGYTIAVDVFDRKDDFDPSLDSVVRVEATRLRNKLREYYDEEGKSDSVHIEFRKGSYVLDFSFQHVTENDQDSGLIVKSTQLTERRHPTVITDIPSLVVLPFVSISEDNSRDYFADGMTDSLISILSRLSGLFVISRQSAFAYKSTIKSSKEIATELGVQYLLESSVQHAGDRLRIATQLVQASNGAHIWSERYDRELKDIFSLQDELTQQIVYALQVELSGAEGQMFGYQDTRSIEAHDALLRGIASFRCYTQKSLQEAILLLSKAIQMDSNYVAAYSWLARTFAFKWSMCWERDKTILDTALTYAKRAVELDANSPFAMSILGWVYLWRKEGESAIVACRQGVLLDKNNAEALLFLSLSLSSAGYGEEGLYYIEKAKRLTPTPAPLYEFALGQCYYVLKEYQKAIDAYEQGIIMSPNFIPTQYLQILAYARLGMEEKVKQKIKTLNEINGFNKDFTVATIWTDENIKKEHQELVNRVFAKYKID